MTRSETSQSAISRSSKKHSVRPRAIVGTCARNVRCINALGRKPEGDERRKLSRSAWLQSHRNRRLVPKSATTIAGGDGSRQPTANELRAVSYQGRRIAEVANKLHA
jgi:hypothetical protein